MYRANKAISGLVSAKVSYLETAVKEGRKNEHIHGQGAARVCAGRGLCEAPVRGGSPADGQLELRSPSHTTGVALCPARGWASGFPKQAAPFARWTESQTRVKTM